MFCVCPLRRLNGQLSFNSVGEWCVSVVNLQFTHLDRVRRVSVVESAVHIEVHVWQINLQAVVMPHVVADLYDNAQY